MQENSRTIITEQKNSDLDNSIDSADKMSSFFRVKKHIAQQK